LSPAAASLERIFLGFVIAVEFLSVIPGQCQASNPESRGSGLIAFAMPRNDEGCIALPDTSKAPVIYDGCSFLIFRNYS
jgi:hypothetical protein